MNKMPLKKVSLLREKKKSQGVRGGEEESHGILEGISSLHSWIKTQTMIRPTKLNAKKDMQYNDDDDEDVVISLTSGDPNISRTRVRWSHNLKTFIPITFTETMIDHLDIESIIVQKDSAEAKDQMRRYGTPMSVREYEKEKRKKVKRRDSEESVESDPGAQNLANQFSNIERATQTTTFGVVNTEMQTEPPPRANFSETVNQWVIYDQYEIYERIKEQEENAEKKNTNGEKVKKKKYYVEKELDPVFVEKQRKMLVSAKILERMVNLNTFDDIAQDFRFWEDACDEFKEGEGSLLPLWKFSFEPAKDLEVTSLCWNPRYNDLFAVGFGSYQFARQPNIGYVCLFSLKNPSYPEFLCEASCGVMCVDIHPQHPHMVVAGLYDGNVAVYNLQSKKKTPSYLSDALNGKHRDVVWQVKWVKDNLDGYLNFFSVSGDGRVTNWTIVKTTLWFTDQLLINFGKNLINFDSNMNDHLLDSGRTIAFKPDEETTFLVGTDEGTVYLATTQYSSQFLMSYPAHSTPVYNIQWNPFIPSIFLTCASEFVVKIFHKDLSKPILRFDVGSQVGDVAWAPYSSTVFAVVTLDGKVAVYDLAINKYNPICNQAIVPKRKAKLNHITFNPVEPLMLVGDSNGNVHSLKLSPNLRKKSREAQLAILSNEHATLRPIEIKKLQRLLDQVVEKEQLDHESAEDSD